MTAAGNKFRHWDSYWQDSRLSCSGPDNEPTIAASFQAYWTEVAAALPAGARVLDLACGNGYVAATVAKAAKAAGKAVQVDGVDGAAIDPKRYLKPEQQPPEGITFKPRTMLESLPFEPQTFDAVLSQYGLEFGSLAKTTAELGRVLKPGGQVRVLALPAAARFIEDLNRKAKQARVMVENTKLFEVSAAVARGINTKEETGQGREVAEYLKKFSGEVQKIMEALDERENGLAKVAIALIQKTLTERKQMSIDDQVKEIGAVKTRFADLAVRNDAIVRSALGDASLNATLRELKKSIQSDFRSQPRATTECGVVAWEIGN